jgi:hypothetical protein
MDQREELQLHHRLQNSPKIRRKKVESVTITN